jgi:hypothetical protein
MVRILSPGSVWDEAALAGALLRPSLRPALHRPNTNARANHATSPARRRAFRGRRQATARKARMEIPSVSFPATGGAERCANFAAPCGQLRRRSSSVLLYWERTLRHTPSARFPCQIRPRSSLISGASTPLPTEWSALAPDLPKGALAVLEAGFAPATTKVLTSRTSAVFPHEPEPRNRPPASVPTALNAAMTT